MSGWPGSLSEVGGKARSTADLPVDVGAPTAEIMMPNWAGVIITTADVIEDELGRRWTVKGAELSTFGWKIVAVEAVA